MQKVLVAGIFLAFLTMSNSSIASAQSPAPLRPSSFKPVEDIVIQSGQYAFKLKGGKPVSFDERSQCLIRKNFIAAVKSAEMNENRRLLPLTEGEYEFADCLPIGAVTFSIPFYISSQVSLSGMSAFNHGDGYNVGILTPTITTIFMSEENPFNLKISSPEIKFRDLPKYLYDFHWIIELRVDRQLANFHYNWTDPTLGSTTPKPLDVPIFIQGIVSRFGSQPSLTTIVEYNPQLRWEGHWTNGTNTYVGVPWKDLPSAKVAHNNKYCLVTFQDSSGLGGRYDPNIESFGLSYDETTPAAAQKYCSNDLETVKRIYLDSIK